MRVMRSPAMPTSARCGGWPLPSTTCPPRTIRSKRCAEVRAAPPRARRQQHCTSQGIRWEVIAGATIIAGLFLVQTPYRHLRPVSRERAACFRPTTMRRCVHFLPPGRILPPHRPAPCRRSARDLGLGALFAKDESGRFGLNAFKLLGARFAIETLLAEGAAASRARRWCARAKAITAAPWRARRARPAAPRASTWRTTPRSARADAIAGEGAEVIRVDGSYDDAVRILQEEAAAHGWTIVSDTAWPGYERIPFLIMLGYTRMMDEVRDQGSGIGDQGSGIGDRRCGLRPGRRRRIAVRHRELVRVPLARSAR